MENNDFVDLDLHSDFYNPELDDLGSENEVEFRNISIRVGRRPEALNLRQLLKATGRKIPPEFKLYRDYDIWLVTMSVGILDSKFEGNRFVNHLGLKAEFTDPGISIIDIVPKSEFKKVVGGNLALEADLGLNGRFMLPKVASTLTKYNLPVELGLDCSVGTEADLVMRLGFSIFTSSITAIGEQDVIGQWIFTRSEKPLLGMQKVAMTVLTPRDLEGSSLKLKAQISASMPSLFYLLPKKFQSDWIELDVELRENKPAN